MLSTNLNAETIEGPDPKEIGETKEKEGIEAIENSGEKEEKEEIERRDPTEETERKEEKEEKEETERRDLTEEKEETERKEEKEDPNVKAQGDRKVARKIDTTELTIGRNREEKEGEKLLGDKMIAITIEGAEVKDRESIDLAVSMQKRGKRTVVIENL